MGKKPDFTFKKFFNKFRDFWTKERVILFLVFIAATVIRSIPGWLNAAWGSDFGIYYGITKDFAENPELFRAYEGWGSTYNYFPVLYVLITFLHYITGIEIVWLLPRVTPIFGGLSVLVFYFVAKEIVEDKKLALLCCAFLAVNPFHIYQTSHAAPMTMGHFFMILSLYFFVKKEKNIASFVALFVCSILLVASHHLTTFFYLITIIFITFYRNFISQKWTKDLRWDVFYIISFSAFTFIYWMLIATPVYRDFIRGGLLIPSWLVIGAFYLGILFLFIIVILRRRFYPISEKSNGKNPSMLILMILTIIICSSFIVIFSFIEIPQTGFIFEKTAIFFLLPLIVAVGFGFYGAFIIKTKSEQGYVFGWLFPIFISLIFTTVTWHKALLPFRHLEYIAYPLAIICGVGVYAYWKELKEKESKGSPSSNRKLTSKTFANIVVIILILNLISAYSVQNVTSRYEESISKEVFDVISWMKGNVTGYNFTIASDHRISQVFWAEGYNVTSDSAYVIWFSENWTESLEELETANGTKPRIEYVVIDFVMRYDGVQSNINETPRNLTPESYEKFRNPPFSLIYRSENIDGNKWAELYEVDWDYIETNRP
jgi:MFS family permease